MIKQLLLFYFFINGGFLFAQLDFAKNIIADLSSEEFHGRGYVNVGDTRAADYIANLYEKLGAQKLGSSYFQDFTFGVNTFPDTVRITVDGKDLITGVDYIVDPATPSINKSYELVYCPPSGWNTVPKLHVGRNDVCFVFDAGKTKDKDSLKLMASYMRQANTIAPVIRIQDTKLTWSVATELRDRALIEVLRDRWDTTAKRIHLNIHASFKAKHTARNVVGLIPGKNKKKFVVVTAHYDHLGRMGSSTYFPGANDNAAGTAQLLNLMKFYSQNQPKYSIVFIAFAAEEAGLIGSKYFVGNPLIDLKKIRFLINLDIMGTGEEGITVVNATKHKKEFGLLQKINDDKKYLVQVKARGEAANSDHYWFTQMGVPAFFMYTMGGSKAYHDVNDKIENLSFSEFEDIASLLRDFIQRL